MRKTVRRSLTIHQKYAGEEVSNCWTAETKWCPLSSWYELGNTCMSCTLDRTPLPPTNIELLSLMWTRTIGIHSPVKRLCSSHRWFLPLLWLSCDGNTTNVMLRDVVKTLIGVVANSISAEPGIPVDTADKVIKRLGPNAASKAECYHVR